MTYIHSILYINKIHIIIILITSINVIVIVRAGVWVRPCAHLAAGGGGGLRPGAVPVGAAAGRSPRRPHAPRALHHQPDERRVLLDGIL